MDDEEERAAAYRAQAQRRIKAMAERAAQLRGNPELRKQLAKNWAPVVLWQQENRR